MQLTIIGATGGTGTCLVEQALAAGHEVTAVVRDPARLAVPAHERLQTVTADVMDPAAIIPAVAGADAVLSAPGPRGRSPESANSSPSPAPLSPTGATGATGPCATY